MSRAGKEAIHIEIDGFNFQWNQFSRDWTNSPTAVNENDSSHTTQGYDLNYTGVIFGNEIGYDAVNDRIIVRAGNYKDRNGSQSISDPAELHAYILNIYKTLMLRGIRGTFVYVCDPVLREYFRKHIPMAAAEKPAATELRILSPEEGRDNDRAVPFINILAAAGQFFEAQFAEPDEYIELPKPLRDRENYFVCKVVGESMNKIIPNGSFCLFHRDEGGSRNGKIVLVQSTEIQDADFGSGYTVKEYHSIKRTTEDGWRHEAIVLRALSDHLEFTTIELSNDAMRDLQVVGIFQKLLQ